MKEEKTCCEIIVELDDKMAHDLAYIAQYEHCSVEELVRRYLIENLMKTSN